MLGKALDTESHSVELLFYQIVVNDSLVYCG
jgi:hypothetical protein